MQRHRASGLAAQSAAGGTGTSESAESSACLSAHMYAGQRINLHGRLDRSLSPLGGWAGKLSRLPDRVILRVIISTYPIDMSDYLSYI